MYSISGSLTGSRSKSKSSSTSQSSGTSSTTSEVLRLDEGSRQALNELMRLLEGRTQEDQPATSGQFTREKAIADAQGQVESIFNQYRDEALPQIFQAQTGAGAYNTTAGQQLANDAYGRATAAASESVLGNIGRYAELEQVERQLGQQEEATNLNALLQVLGIQSEATVRSKEDSRFKTTSKSTSRNTSQGQGASIAGSYSGMAS